MDIKTNRQFMKSDFTARGLESDQTKGLPQPALEKNIPNDVKLIKLDTYDQMEDLDISLSKAINNRRSRRVYSDELITLKELSYLLWTTQGVKEVIKEGYATLRTVPSGGARHPFETYLYVNKVEGLEKGIYKYSALNHSIYFLYNEDNLKEKIIEGCLNQNMAGEAAVTFIWSCIPYRGEWRYNVVSHKAMLLDGGHVCQNLYLACEAINCGTCAIAAYDQEKMDNLVKIDGENEYVVYVSPVGKTKGD